MNRERSENEARKILQFSYNNHRKIIEKNYKKNRIKIETNCKRTTGEQQDYTKYNSLLSLEEA